MNTHTEKKVNMKPELPKLRREIKKHNIISEMKTKPDALLGRIDLTEILIKLIEERNETTTKPKWNKDRSEEDYVESDRYRRWAKGI